MKNHIKVYTEFFGITNEDKIPCEYCGKEMLVDVHHIENKGQGGSKNKDYIENLIGLGRNCHTLAHQEKISKDELREVHQKNVDNGFLKLEV